MIVFVLIAGADFDQPGWAKAKLKINGQATEEDLNLADNLLTGWVYSKEWNQALRDIEEADYPLLYDEEEIAAHKETENSPLGVGKILKFTFEHAKAVDPNCREIEAAFHIAFGE